MRVLKLYKRLKTMQMMITRIVATIIAKVNRIRRSNLSILKHIQNLT